ncbi:MAG TPA: hypothetical protein VK921_16060, partial [Anditalea sp.]|nr:hypothetical protein [Anditalea sp.]
IYIINITLGNYYIYIIFVIIDEQSNQTYLKGLYFYGGKCPCSSFPPFLVRRKNIIISPLVGCIVFFTARSILDP